MAVFGSARSGINSAADLEAAGWDYSVGHFNHENYATSADYLAFFTVVVLRGICTGGFIKVRGGRVIVACTGVCAAEH